MLKPYSGHKGVCNGWELSGWKHRDGFGPGLSRNTARLSGKTASWKPSENPGRDLTLLFSSGATLGCAWAWNGEIFNYLPRGLLCLLVASSFGMLNAKKCAFFFPCAEFSNTGAHSLLIPTDTFPWSLHVFLVSRSVFSRYFLQNSNAYSPDPYMF